MVEKVVCSRQECNMYIFKQHDNNKFTIMLPRVNNLYIEESILLSNASVETRSVKL